MRFHHIIILILCFLFGLGAGYVTMGEAHTQKQVESIPEPTLRAPEWVKRDSENVLKRGASLLISSPLSHIIGRVLKKDPALNLEDALEQILTSKENPEKIREALIILFTRWAEVDLDGALKRMELIQPSDYLHFIKFAIFTKMINNDPKEAALYYEKNKEDLHGHKYYFLPDLGKQWARQAPEEAWNWIVSLKEGQDGAMMGFFSGLDTDPATIGKYMDQIIADETLRDNTHVSSLIRNWAKQDFTNTVNWIESLHEKGKNELWEYAVIGAAEHDLDLATTHLYKVPERNLPRTLASVAEVVQREQGSEAALNWMIERVPEGARYLDFKILSNWSSEDPENAKKWLLPFSPGDQWIRDQALEAYVRYSNDPDHNETIKMAQTIKSPELQKQAMESALQNWKRNDPSEARQWVNNFAGAAEIKQSLQKIVE